MEVGIDISKLKFDVVFLNNENKSQYKTFSNDEEGFDEFKKWIKSVGALKAHYCMEATGRYGEALAWFLSTNDLKVSVITPHVLKPLPAVKVFVSKRIKLMPVSLLDFAKHTVLKHGFLLHLSHRLSVISIDVYKSLWMINSVVKIGWKS